jgi:hypothetical protein
VNTAASDEVNRLESELIGLFRQLSSLQTEIQNRLVSEADGKILKGNELVGWLGEIYGKILLGGKLVSDREEHDFVCPNGQRVSVKTRKGWGSGWKQTSAIPKIEGEECPTDLMFVHLNDDYSIDRVWIYPWERLIQERRFASHVVRGQHRSFIFRVDERRDDKHLIYGRAANNSLQERRP